jgi:hypothetical protein
MVFIGCAVISFSLGLFALVLLVGDGPLRSRSENQIQTWKKRVLLFMLIALESCVLSNVAVFLFLALLEFARIVPSHDGIWEVVLGYLVVIAPYMALAMLFLFAFVVLLASLWRREKGVGAK